MQERRKKKGIFQLGVGFFLMNKVENRMDRGIIIHTLLLIEDSIGYCLYWSDKNSLTIRSFSFDFL